MSKPLCTSLRSCYSPVHTAEQICVGTLWQTKHESQQQEEVVSQEPLIGISRLKESFHRLNIFTSPD